MNGINQIKSCRNSNIEILRLLLMVAIMGWHVMLHGMGFSSIDEGSNQMNIKESLEIILTALFAPATYCFMFISGYYGLKFTLNKLISLEVCLILCSLFTLILSYYLFDIFSIRNLFYSLIPVSTMKWWFMTCYMLLFLLTPIFNSGIEAINKKSFSFILLSLIIYHILSFLLFKENSGSNFLGLLTIFLIGRYCNIYKINVKRNNAMLIFLSCWLLLVFLLFLCFFYCKMLVLKLLNYNTPLIMIMSVMAFYFVKNLKPIYSCRINEVLKSTLFIYLISEGLGMHFYIWLASFFIDNNICVGILAVLGFIIMSLMLGQVLLFFTSWLLKILKLYRLKI